MFFRNYVAIAKALKALDEENGAYLLEAVGMSSKYAKSIAKGVSKLSEAQAVVEMATANCPVCGGHLEVEDDDLRSEWERIRYFCKKCDFCPERLITFKTQSSMTESDEWENLPEKGPMFEPGQTVLLRVGKVKVKVTVAQRHVEEGRFHYHVREAIPSSGFPEQQLESLLVSESLEGKGCP